MNKYKLTYENGKTETVFSEMAEAKMKAHYEGTLSKIDGKMEEVSKVERVG